MAKASKTAQAATEDLAEDAGPSSAEANDSMLMAVASGDAWALRRAIEQGAAAWLFGPECRSDDPQVNPALAALLSPFGSECIEQFDAFFGDMRSWTHGRWNSAHWAVASKNEPVLAWALSAGAKSRGESELSLLGAEAESEERPGGPRRTALALAAQMGDPAWLARVLEISEECGEGVAKLAKGDRRSSVSALGLAMFELADAERQGAPKSERAAREACAEMLFGLGFPIDGSKAPTAKLAVALALANPGKKAANKAMAKAARRAIAMGSGAVDGQRPAGAYEAAGLALDVDWARALDLCGMSEPGDGSFALGASKRMLEDLRECSGDGGWQWARMGSAGDLAERVEASLAAAPIALADSPLGGMEAQTARWMVDVSKGRRDVGADQFKELIELALMSAQSPGAAPGAKRRSLRV